MAQHPTTSMRSLQNPFVTRTVYFLRNGAKRFSEIERALDIRRPATLSDLLRKMARDGIVERRMLSAGPPACVEYLLTELGRSLAGPASAMAEWISEHVDEIEHARARSRVDTEAWRAAELKAAV
jgi:DNA-binding HxlR family transcriptional regulator